MAIVWPCPLEVDAYAAAGRHVVVPRPDCPSCQRAMVFWSGYFRHLRSGTARRLWVRRARCVACRLTHALLPAFCLPGRLDSVEVIGPALASATTGIGDRRAAVAADVAHTTAREWRRCHRRRAPALAAGFAATAVSLGAPAPVLSGEAELTALQALGAAWAAARLRLGEAVLALWRFAAVVSGGSLLATTTNSPWAGAGGRRLIPPLP